MILHYLIAFSASCGIFILFLVLSRTLNALINHLIKLQYLLQKEYDMKKELLDINQILQDDEPAANHAGVSESIGHGGEPTAPRQ
jgi:hypothetical protein